MNQFEKALNDLDAEKETGKSNTSVIARVFGLPLAPILAVGFILFEAFVIMTLWNWFLLALTGITMTLLAAMALDLIGAIIIYSPKKRSTYETLWGMWQVIKLNILVLLIGFVLHLFV